MSTIWIVVADQARARIFATDSSKDPLVEIHTEVSMAGQKSEQDLVSDKPGRSYDSQGAARHAMGNAEDHKEHEAITFAKTLAKHLESSKQTDEYLKLVIVATPHFLGLLRKELGQATIDSISLEVDKDLTKLSAADIREHLPERL